MLNPKAWLLAVIVGLLVVVSSHFLTVAQGVELGAGMSERDDSTALVDPYALQDTAFVIGGLTPAGRGAVRLSAQDSTKFAAPFFGLGLLPKVSLLPAFWRITPLMDNLSASHWTFPVDLVAEGINATTPAPSAAGDAADLNRGPYKFRVEAFTKDKRPYSRAANVTITIQRGAVSLGTYDSTNPAFLVLGRLVPSSSFTGDAILLSTGIDRTAVTTNLGALRFNRTVTIKHADPRRPGGIISLGFSNCSNIVVTGISFTGDLQAIKDAGYNLQGVVSFGGGSTNMAVRSCNATFEHKTAQIVVAAVQFAGCTNCEVSDFYAFRMNSGISDKQNSLNADITVTRFRMRQFYNNAIWLGNAKNITFVDCATIGAMRYTGDHIDHVQVADGAAPQGLRMIRHQMYKAEGNGGAQGFFGGTPGLWQGYIDNNSTFGRYSGVAGNVLTITSSGNYKPLVQYTWVRGANFPQLVQVAKIGTTNGIVGQYIIDKSVKAAPGLVHTAPFNDLTLNGVSSTGFMRNVLYLRGLAGQSTIKAYTASMVNPNTADVAWTYFRGTLINKTLTVTEFQSGPPMTTFIVEMANGTKLNGTGRALITTWVSGTGQNGTYLVEGSNFNYPKVIALRGASDTPHRQNEGPGSDFLGVDVPSLYSPGQSTVSSLDMWSDYNRQPGFRNYTTSGVGFKPASLTIDTASTVFNNANSTVASACFAQGDPQLGPKGLELISPAEWEKMSFDEVIRRHVAALSPRVGGPLTSGTQDFGAFTRNGLWNDGSGKRPY